MGSKETRVEHLAQVLADKRVQAVTLVRVGARWLTYINYGGKAYRLDPVTMYVYDEEDTRDNKSEDI